CVTLFLREETLFRGPEGGTAIFPRPAPREAPTAAAALFLFAGALALVWYGQSWLPKGIVRSVLATQFLVILAPCAALMIWLRANPRTTFRFRATHVAALAAALLVGLAAPILNEALYNLIGSSTPSPE